MKQEFKEAADETDFERERKKLTVASIVWPRIRIWGAFFSLSGKCGPKNTKIANGGALLCVMTLMKTSFGRSDVGDVAAALQVLIGENAALR